MRVTYFQRKRRPGTNFSVEKVFDDVRDQLSNEIESRTWIAPFFSCGLFRRLAIGISAFWNRDEINHVTGDINFVALFLPKQTTVLTILDLGILSVLTGFKRWLVWLFWFQIPAWRCAYVTVISEATRESLLKVVRCDPDKVIVVPVAISGKFKRTLKPFDTSCPTILHVGTTPNKNLPRVIEALRGIPCKLWIIGQLSISDIDLLCSGEICYSNWVGLKEEEVVERYNGCDIVVFASTFEGFGMPILEANAVGRPVITSNVTSMPEVAGKAAYLVDPYCIESISVGVRTLISDEKLREQLVANGFENLQRYKSMEISRAYLALYRRLAGE